MLRRGKSLTAEPIAIFQILVEVAIHHGLVFQIKRNDMVNLGERDRFVSCGEHLGGVAFTIKGEDVHDTDAVTHKADFAILFVKNRWQSDWKCLSHWASLLKTAND